MAARRLWLVLTVAFYAASIAALYHYGLARTASIHDFISDECWYVSAAVNVARNVLGLQLLPKVNDSFAVYTVFYKSNCTLNEVLQLLGSRVPGFHVARNYSKISAVAVYVPLSEAGRVRLLKGEGCVGDVVPGLMPDEENINFYLNTEHPPLVKYVLALILYLAGFKFALFRLASFAVAAAGLAAVYAMAYWALKRWGVEALPSLVIPLTVVLFDKSVQSMSSVAMLDVYAASLDAIAIALLLYGRPLAALLVLGVAGAAKYTGLFPLPAVLAYLYIRGWSRWRLLAAAALPLLVVAVFWLPFVARYGVGWTVDQIVGALKWHTTSRPPGGPPTTDPLGLLLGRPGFTLYYLPNGKPYLVAASNPGVTLSALAISLLSSLALLVALCNGLRVVGEGDEELAAAMLALPVTVLGYAAVWMAGNHTLYNFYSVQLSLLAAGVLTLYPIVLRSAAPLAARSIATCLLERGGARWVYAVVITASALLSAALRRPFTTASWSQPLYSLLNLPPGKLEKLGLASVSLLAYMLLALQRGKPPGSGLRFSLETIAWAVAGLTALWSVEAAIAPVALLAVAGEPLTVDALVLGAIIPAPLYCLLASRSSTLRHALRLLAGYEAALTSTLLFAKLAGANPSPLALAIPPILTLCSLLPLRVAAAALVALEPGLAPLLPLSQLDGTAPLVLAIAANTAYVALAVQGVDGLASTLIRLGALATAALAYIEEAGEKEGIGVGQPKSES